MLRSIRLHRLIAALVVAFAFLVSSVEVLLPEIHDGDAGAPVAASTIAPCSVDREASSVIVAHVEASGANHHSDAPTTPLSHHGPHVDHCGHSHLITVASASVRAWSSVHLAAPVTTLSMLTSVDLPLHKRPPIA